MEEQDSSTISTTPLSAGGGAHDTKDAQHAAKRSPGIAGFLPFLHRGPSMDTDNDPRSSDRPRKAQQHGGPAHGGGGAGMMGGGKVKPGGAGFGSGKHHQHRHSISGGGDLHAGGDPPSSPVLSGGALAADSSPAGAWASASYAQAAGAGDVTDTLSLSHLSPAPIATGGTPTRGNSSSSSGFFKNFSFKKRSSSSKGSASPGGVPSSPVLPGATPPPHGSGFSFSASASSNGCGAGAGAGGDNSQSPSDSLCRGMGVVGGASSGSVGGGGLHHHHAGSAGCSKLAQYSSSGGDPDDGDFGSCYSSDAMHSPSFGYQEDATLNLQQGGYGPANMETPPHVGAGFSADATSPLACMRGGPDDLPDVFTPGFNQLFNQGSSSGMGQQLGVPDTPIEQTVRLVDATATVALVSSAQLAQAGQVYDAPSLLLEANNSANTAAAATPAAAPQDPRSPAAAPAAGEAAVTSSSGGQTLLEVEDVAEAAAAESAVAQSPAISPELQEEEAAAAAPIAAEDICVDVSTEPVAAAAAHSEEPAAAGEPQAAGRVVPAAPASPAAVQVGDEACSPAASPVAVCAADAEPSACAVDTAGPDERVASPTRQAAAAEEPTVQSPAQAAASPSVQHIGAEEQQHCAEPPASPAAAGAEADETCSSPVAAAAALPAQEQHAAATDDATGDAPAALQQEQHQEPAHQCSSTDNQQAAGGADAPRSPSPVSAAPGGQDSAEQHQHCIPPQQQSVADEAQETPAAPAPAAEQDVGDAPCTAAQSPVQAAQPDAAAAAEEEGQGAELHPPAAASPGPAHSPELAAEASADAAVMELGAEGSAAEYDEQPAAVSSPSSPVLAPEASDEFLLPPQCDADFEGPASPTAATVAAGPGSSMSPVVSGLTPGRAGSSRRTPGGRTPVSMVRESMPLFVSDPSRAVGSALVVEESLEDQDMQQLVGAGPLLLAAGGAAAAASSSRLLSHGGPQRVAASSSSLLLNPLTPVAEGFTTSPIPEETSTGGSSQSRSSSRYEAAAAGSPGSSPVRQLALHHQHSSGSPNDDNNGGRSSSISPQAGVGGGVGGGPLFSGVMMTPGSVYSTPTLTLGQAGLVGGRTQLGGTPASALSSAVGSAIRDIHTGDHHTHHTHAAAGGGVGGTSGMMLPDVSPTLALLPSMGAGPGMGQGGSVGDGSTPSLLDAKAASPSAVWLTNTYTTPFRGALAALPIDAARHAPLVDNSPCDLTDDGSFEKAGFGAEAQRVAQNLAAAAAFGATPLPVRTHGVGLSQQTPGQLLQPERPLSPEITGELRDGMVDMMVKKVAALEKRVKEVEGDNLRLKEQVEIYEFEKTELNSQEEMERQARSYAEEQLTQCQMELQAMRQAKNQQAAQVAALQQEFEALRQQAEAQHAHDREQQSQLETQLAAMQGERNQALDRINLLDMELTAVRSAAADLQGALQKEQGRAGELEGLVAAKDRELSDMSRIQHDTQLKMDKALEQLISSKTAKEHLHNKAADEAAKAAQYFNERQQLLAERQSLVTQLDKRNADWQAFKAKYAHKSSTLKEVEQRLAAKEAEVTELMAMCDQLLQQQEQQR